MILLRLGSLKCENGKKDGSLSRLEGFAGLCLCTTLLDCASVSRGRVKGDGAV